VRHALATAIEAAVGPVELWCAPDTTHPFFERCARYFHVALETQAGADLGARMRHAAEASIAARRALVIIGSDCPALTAAHLRDAASALREHDVVIAPAEDGGYVLVGLSRAVPGLFEDVAWGSPSVMAQSRARLAGAGARWKELAPLWDVDRPEDYARLQREGLLADVLS
jgi:rSAM/selenodomain-associated transferase 1